MKSKALFISLVTFTIIFNSLSAQNVKLKYHYQKGKTYQYNIAANTNAVIEMGGKENKIRTTTNQLYDFAVENVKEGKATILTTCKDMEVSTKAMGKDTTMKLPQLIGQRIRFTLLPDGRMMDVQKLDSTKLDIMQGLIKTSGLSFRFQKLPDNAVKYNDSWTFSKTDSTYDQNKNLLLNSMNLKLTLEKEEMKNGHKCQKVNYTGDLALKGKTMMQGMEIYQDGSGNSKGTFWLDSKTGILIIDESETNVDATISVIGQDGMTLPTSVVAKSTLSLVE